MARKRIAAAVFGDGRHYRGLVLVIGDAVPLVGAAQDLGPGLTLGDELADDAGQVVFTLLGVLRQGLIQESGETVIAGMNIKRKVPFLAL